MIRGARLRVARARVKRRMWARLQDCYRHAHLVYGGSMQCCAPANASGAADEAKGGRIDSNQRPPDPIRHPHHPNPTQTYTPVNSGSQTQWKSSQMPWFEQSFGHERRPQSLPVCPGLQKHVPFEQKPTPLQSAGQSALEQSSPANPSSQWHVVPTQLPWAEHPLGHTCIEQLKPEKPEWQRHSPS